MRAFATGVSKLVGRETHLGWMSFDTGSQSFIAFVASSRAIDWPDGILSYSVDQLSGRGARVPDDPTEL